MFDVRITEIATQRISNFFDQSEADVQAFEDALDPGLFEMLVWYTPVEGEDLRITFDSREPQGGWPELDFDPDYHEECLACTDSERYDDHMHSSLHAEATVQDPVVFIMPFEEEMKWEAARDRRSERLHESWATRVMNDVLHAWRQAR